MFDDPPFRVEAEDVHAGRRRTGPVQVVHVHEREIAVDRDGWQKIPFADMQAAGMPTFNPASYRLYTGGVEQAIRANAGARKTLEGLSRMNLFALAFRTNNMKTAAGRVRKIETLVAMLARGETIVPQKARKA